MPQKLCEHTCPIENALHKIGGKWKTIILWHLSLEKKRYGELKRLVPNVSEKMLIQSLRELEKDKLIARYAYPEIPPRVEYALTKTGKSLIPIISALHAWGNKYA